MAYATDHDLVTRIPGANKIDPAIRAIALSDARARLSDTAYGARAVAAHAYLAGHLLALRSDVGAAVGGVSAPVTSIKAGEISATFATAAGTTAADLSRTKWGTEFLAISQTVTTRPQAV